MTLPRYIPTRLGEAGAREAKGCFAQPSLGLESQYKDDSGAWKIKAFPVIPGQQTGQQITPLQVNVVSVPQDYDTGIGGVNETTYSLVFGFFFPPNVVMFDVGANSHLDHIYALRDWLATGGSWAARLGRTVEASPIEDPDSAGTSLGSLIGFQWSEPRMTVGNAAIFVPVLVTYQTREDSRGVKR